MSRVQLIARPGIGPIDVIHPALRFQNGLSVISVEIQQSLQVGFVVIRVGLWTDESVVESNADLFEEGMSRTLICLIRVGLWTDESVVESNADLFEEGMSYAVDQERVFGGHQVPATSFLETQFDFEITARQIHVIFLRIDLKIDRVDPCGEGMNGHHAITHHAEIGRGDIPEFQGGILHPCRSSERYDVSHRRLILLFLFLTALRTQSSFKRFVRVGKNVPPFCRFLRRLKTLTTGGMRRTRLE